METNCTTCNAAYPFDYAVALIADRLKEAAQMESSTMRTTLLRRYFTQLGGLLSELPA